MRQTDFDYLRSAVESLSGSSDLLLWSGSVRVIETGMNSPYRSRRHIEYEEALAPADDVLIVANRRKLLLVTIRGTIFSRTETVEKALPKVSFQPVEGWGWDGPRAEWTIHPVARRVMNGQLAALIDRAVEYGVVAPSWGDHAHALVSAAWPVPVVVGWDEDGRPVFSWPASEPESEPVDKEEQ